MGEGANLRQPPDLRCLLDGHGVDDSRFDNIQLNLNNHDMMNIAIVFFVLFAVVAPCVEFVGYPRLVRASAERVPGARSRYYLLDILFLWVSTACLFTIWLLRGRPWTLLGLAVPAPLRLGFGLMLFGGYLVIAFRQRTFLLAQPEVLRRTMRRSATMEALLPHTAAERRGFFLLALSAGFCEEVLFRGFVMWYVARWIGPVLAVAISAILFGLQHAYLGRQHVLNTSVAGAVFAFIVVASGSLWPAILIHAAMDLFSGDLGFRALGDSQLSAAEGEPLST
jgi:membrane protease YdiL (CAAX protease family)